MWDLELSEDNSGVEKERGKEPPPTLWSSDNRRERESIVNKLEVEEHGMGCVALRKSCPSESGVHDMENKQGDILTKKASLE